MIVVDFQKKKSRHIGGKYRRMHYEKDSLFSHFALLLLTGCRMPAKTVSQIPSLEGSESLVPKMPNGTADNSSDGICRQGAA